jgi:Co/Zn/Cd efflux system component
MRLSCRSRATTGPEGASVAGHHERRTRWVVGVTAVMMTVELVVGRMSGSMALTADGWHMATHVGALGLASLAYWFARTRARHPDFAFGTGKVSARGQMACVDKLRRS